jgi:hypothetical protein
MGEHMLARGLDVELEAYAPRSGADHATPPSALHKWLMHNLYSFTLHHDRHVFHDAHEAARELGHDLGGRLKRMGEALSRPPEVIGM